MRTFYFLTRTAVIITTGIISCFILSNCGEASGETSRQPAKSPVITKEDSKFCKLISAKDIRSAISKSKKKEVIMGIYPVKLSDGSKKNDFDLAISFQDASEGHKKIQSKIDNKLFETQSAWYVSFLKNKNVSRNKIPSGYYLKINDSFIKDGIGISFCLNPGENNMYYYLLTNNSSKGYSPMSATKESKDSTCKCPPDCCKYFIMKSDSTGKCPPECVEYLLHKPIVEANINKIYSNN